MQLPLVNRPCDSSKQRKRNKLLLALANRVANFQNPFAPRPSARYKLSDAKNARVNFGSVLYNPADELFGPCDPFENLMRQLKAATTELKKKYAIAKTPADLKLSIEASQLVAFHCLEGGFGVGTGDQIEANVATLAREGVAYITLAHLIFRDVAANVNAFPFMSDAEYERMFTMPVKGLTESGVRLCEAMCRSGIIPDITHATREAADQVFEITGARDPKLPVLVTHGAPQGGTANEHKLNLDERTIRRIRDTGGVIGVIFFDHWLLPVSASGEKRSIDLVVNAINRIRHVAGTTDCIAIGSDLDGFIEPVKGLENVGKFRDLEAKLRKSFEEPIVEGILWRNALRALSAGWGVKAAR